MPPIRLLTRMSHYRNRFFVHDIKVEAKLETFDDESKEPPAIAVEAALVVSEDLPELWAFADIAVSIQVMFM